MKHCKMIVFSVWLVAVLSQLCVADIQHKRNKLLYMLLDGFRYDYLDDQKEDLPGFRQFLKDGVQAEWVTPIYPSLSYPSWTTLATGQWPETHGIVGNYFYDAEDKDYFSLFDPSSTVKPKWWKSEPIWTTATKADIKTAVILWSRCDILYDGVVPEFCEHFIPIRGAMVFKQSIDKALSKLDDGFEFVQMYNEHVDNFGHSHGPDSEELKEAVRVIDEGMVYLEQQLQERNLTDHINIVIVSDHGMASTTPKEIERIEIDQYIPMDSVESIADKGAFLSIKVVDNKVEQVYTALKKMPGVDILKKADIPDRLHIKNNRNIHEIIVKTKIGNWVMASKNKDKSHPDRNDHFTYYGGHGYDNAEEKMRGIFFAKGPDFKTNMKIPSINAVDVYQLVAHLLEVKPRPHNGTWDNVRPALLHDISNGHTLSPTMAVVMITIITSIIMQC